MRYKLTLAYDGTHFHGWQKQHPPDSDVPLRTVQEHLEQTVRQVVREEVLVVGASRTDAGVHALGQVAAFTAQIELEPVRLLMAINSRLDPDVRIMHVKTVPDDFDPISDAVCKQYRYSMKHSCCDGEPAPLFDRHYLYWTPYRMNVDAMQRAAQYIVGEHDFASFTRVHHGRESTVREVLSCDVTATDELHCHIDIVGRGFLYNMVRIIAGTLVEIGRGKWPAEHIHDILAARDRAAAGPTLPPEGLCLQWISYDEDAAQRSRA